MEAITNNMGCITSIGPISTDHIYVKKDGIIKYVTSIGGGSAGNFVLHLSSLGHKTNIISLIGNDKISQIAIKDFNRFNVNTSGLIRKDELKIKQSFSLITFDSKKNKYIEKNCPICSQPLQGKNQFRSSFLNESHFDIIKKSKLIYISIINESYLKIAKVAKENNIPVIIDFSTLFKQFIKVDLLVDAIKCADIIYLSEKNMTFLSQKFGIVNFWDINNQLKGWIIFSNKGNLISNIRTKNKCDQLTYNINEKGKINIDIVKDVFLAYFIDIIDKQSYYNCNLELISLDNWRKAIETSISIVIDSFKNYGSRTYLYIKSSQHILNNEESLIELINDFGEKVDENCPCKIDNSLNFQMIGRKVSVEDLKKNKGRNLFETNLLNIPLYVSSVLSNFDSKNNFDLNNYDDLIFIGSGGSYTTAITLNYVYQYLVNKRSQCLTPLEYVLLGKELLPVVLISAGGTNSDIRTSFKKALDLKAQKVFFITTNLKSKLYIDVSKLSFGKCLLVNTPWEEKGFVSVLNTVAMTIFGLKSIIVMNWDDQYEKFLNYDNLTILINESIQRAKDEFNNIVNSENILPTHIIGLGSGWSWPAVINLESIVIESGLSTIEISDLKNYTHGRYLSLYNNPIGKIVLLYETPKTSRFVDFLYMKFTNITHVIILKSQKENIIGTIELLIQTFAFCNEFGLRKNIDMAKPIYPEEAKGLYEWDKIY